MTNRLLDCIRRAALLRDGGGLSDGQLLALFVKHRDGDAFAALLNRHGPMVMGVCHRVLRNQQDAEDAFQATFLIFARKAGSVHAQDSLAGWLYRVAYRTALQARARHRGKEQQVKDLPDPAIESDDGQRDLLVLLLREIDRLPDKYRVPVVLCELEGRSRREVARMLGVPEGTLSWRLAQAKKLLGRRLSRYGSVAVGALFSESTASACLTHALRTSTTKAVLTAGTVPASVLTLTDVVVKAMLLTKLKITVCFGALMLLTGIGATGLTYRATAQQPKQGVALASRPQADELEALRLEIEALRKSLQATRERVKVLEDEMRAQKGESRTAPRQTAPAEPAGPMIPRPRGTSPTYSRPEDRRPRMPSPPTDPYLRKPDTTPVAPSADNLPPTSTSPKRPGTAGDPLGDAQEALKKLRENPGDKQATEALERALKYLKEREKPRTPAGAVPQ